MCFKEIVQIGSFYFSAAQCGQQRAGLICGSDGDVHQSGAYSEYVCGRPREARPGTGKHQELNPFISRRKKNSPANKGYITFTYLVTKSN